VGTPDADVHGTSRPLDQPVLLVGRGTGDNHLRIAGDRSLSRTHAALSFDKAMKQYVLEDQGSSNGTFVNGQRIEREHLRPGDVVRVGETVMLLLDGSLADPDPEQLARSGMVGVSAALASVLEQAERVGPTDLHVLIQGDSGVGKELVARYIHACSGLEGPFVALNCATLRPELAASELFGHKRGAFSGADRDHEGLFVSAAGGTLFLDEIGELRPDIQAQLLRAIESREIRAVGAARTRSVSARLVAATNVELHAATGRGEFRADLYARLAQWVIPVPALHKRREDVGMLTRHFLAQFAPDTEYELSADAVEALCLHTWPMNVRELASVLRRITIELPEGGRIESTALPQSVLTGLEGRDASVSITIAPPLPRPEGPPSKAELEHLLNHFEGHVTDIARHLGRHRVQVHRWLKRHDLRAADYRR
jgi:DNA-binding NtrC family response regulator